MPLTKCDVTGVQQTIAASRNFSRRITKTLDQALEQCANYIYKKSQVLVPVDTSALKESGEVLDPLRAGALRGKGLGTRYAVVYGGARLSQIRTARGLPPADQMYAVYVHEDPFMYHSPPTQANYLSDAVQQSKAYCNRILGRKMRTV